MKPRRVHVVKLYRPDHERQLEALLTLLRAPAPDSTPASPSATFTEPLLAERPRAENRKGDAAA